MKISEINFGVEIEFTGIHRKKIAELISKQFKVIHKKRGSIYEMDLGIDKIWKIVRDSSIRIENTVPIYEEDMYKNELVSPICNLCDIKTVRKMVNLITNNGGLVNDSCGLHVHVGAEIHDLKSIPNMTIFWIVHQQLFINHFNTTQKSLERYCKILPTKLKENLLNYDNLSFEDFKKIWYQGYDDVPSRYNKSRYQTLNLNSLFTIGTAEFRIGKGSLDMKYIVEYIKFCLLINKKAIEDEQMKYKQFDNMKQVLIYLNHEFNG